MTKEEQEAARDADIEEILSSNSKKKVILAGPGTGKSFLLAEAIKRKRGQGKSKFHAITFLGKLENTLADDLAGLSETSTLHSFARTVVLTALPTWRYFKDIKDIIYEDIGRADGGEKSIVWDEEYQERNKFYRAVGHADVVYWAVSLMKENADNIPLRDLFLIDEFQDFNEIENEFIEQLASQNEILIVGDDDQALYLWKGGHPQYIRDKYHVSNEDYQSFTLRWCNRCTGVIVDTFHLITNNYKGPLKDRTPKDYLCFIPKKGKDSELNPNICLMRTGQYSIAKQIKCQLIEILKTQSIKSVLVIGEDKSTYKLLTIVAKSLREAGFRFVEYKYDTDNVYQFEDNYIEAYRILNQDKASILAWRVLADKLSPKDKKHLLSNFKENADDFIKNLDDSFKADHTKYANALQKIKDGPESARGLISSATVEKLEAEVTVSSKEKREIFTRQLIKRTNHLPSPLSNLEITVCNIMGSKGLGADVVFLLGFDDKKLPAKSTPTEGEIYQFLVALTRTKKRMYLINTLGCNVSKFYDVVKDKVTEVENIF